MEIIPGRARSSDVGAGVSKGSVEGASLARILRDSDKNKMIKRINFMVGSFVFCFLYHKGECILKKCEEILINCLSQMILPLAQPVLKTYMSPSDTWRGFVFI